MPDDTVNPSSESGRSQPQPQSRITVLIADDHASVRAGLRLLLDMAADIEVVGEAADGAAGVIQVRALQPDVVLMDARMPGTDGIAATRQIVADHQADVLMLTTFDLDEVVFGALRAGAAGFLLKSVEPQQLIEAIRSVAAGDGVVAPEITRKLLRTFVAAEPGNRDNPAEHMDEEGPAARTTEGTSSRARVSAMAMPKHSLPSLPADLTPREMDVLAALGRGLSNAQIADELFISLATVKSHVSSLLTKLQVSSRMQAAIYARETGLG